jgi:uncharacterized protein
MILVDTNLLVYSVDSASPFHDDARKWLGGKLNGPLGVGLPWQALNGFARLVSNPRVSAKPMSTAQAWSVVDEWLGLQCTFTPEPTQRHQGIMTDLLPSVTRAELIPDAHLAALAIEYGLVLCSTDNDFDRFAGLNWMNPLNPR